MNTSFASNLKVIQDGSTGGTNQIGLVVYLPEITIGSIIKILDGFIQSMIQMEEFGRMLHFLNGGG